MGSIFALATFAPVSFPLTLQQAQADSPTNATASASSPEASTEERSEPIHQVDENHEGGIESIQLIFVGAAIVIALGLAYRAGRRRRDK